MTYEVRGYVRCNRCNEHSQSEASWEELRKTLTREPGDGPVFPSGGRADFCDPQGSYRGRRDLCARCFRELVDWFFEDEEKIKAKRDAAAAATAATGAT